MFAATDPRAQRSAVGARLARAAAVGFALVLWLSTVPAANAAAAGFSYGGDDCHEAVVIFEVTADAIRDFVPPDYEIGTFGVEPVASANVAMLSCKQLVIDGRRTTPWTMSSLGVQVRRGVEGPYFNNFQVWAPSNNAAIASRWAALGLGERGFVEGLESETSFGDIDVAAPTGVPSSHSTTSVPWSYSPYRLEVETTGPFSPPADRSFTIWTAGSQGNVTINGDIRNESVQTGTATLSAEPGSPLAKIIGGTKVTGAGLIAKFAFDATAVRGPSD